MVAVFARLSSLLSTWGLLCVLALCSLFLTGGSAGAAAASGSCCLDGIVQTSACARVQLDLHGSESRSVGEVRLNGELLAESIDYALLGDDSNTGTLVFTVPLRRGDHLQIVVVPTPERASGADEIAFY